MAEDRPDSPQAQALRKEVQSLRYKIIAISTGDKRADDRAREPLQERTRDLRYEHLDLVGWDMDEVFYPQ